MSKASGTFTGRLVYMIVSVPTSESAEERKRDGDHSDGNDDDDHRSRKHAFAPEDDQIHDARDRRGGEQERYSSSGFRLYGWYVWQTSDKADAGQSRIRPSLEIVTTCHGRNLPLAFSAFSAALCSPPQQGTSIRTMVTLLMSLFLMISVSFSV